MKIITLLGIFILVSCGNRSKPTITQHYISDSISYLNGNLFCKGEYLVIDTIYEHRGEWNYYYPTGILDHTIKFDKDGNEVEYSSYYQGGILKHQYVDNNITETIKDFDLNGNLYSMEQYKVRNDYYCDTDTSTFFLFYPNNKVASETVYFGNDIISKTAYDSVGKIILMVNEKNGRLIKQ